MVSLDTALIVGSVIAMNSLLAAIFIAYGMSVENHLFGIKEYILNQSITNERLLKTDKKILKFFTNELSHWLERNDKK